jgi:stage II sporulation protein D
MAPGQGVITRGHRSVAGRAVFVRTMTAFRLGLCWSIAVLAVAAAPARAEYVIDGHGFGHCAGLSQYGAFGYASEEGRDHRWILAHYYAGTRTATVPAARIRVRLKDTPAQRVELATLVRAAGGRKVRLDPARRYRFDPWEADGFVVVDTTTGRSRARLRGPVRISGPTPLRVLGMAENGVVSGRYRGRLVLTRDGARTVVVDDVDAERYLRAVVPAEMPASWPAAALRAQAVAARSYALTSRRPPELFDVFTDTRSQMYRGLVAETAATTAAVDATRHEVVMTGSTIARTFFHSSSGGVTAGVDEAFGGPPVPYLRSVEDPYDRLSPYHDWTVDISDADAQDAMRPWLTGDLVDLQVVARTATGRAATVRLTGTFGFRDVPAASVRTAFGLRSTWFDVRRQPVVPGG